MIDRIRYHEHKPWRNGRDRSRCRFCFRRIWANHEWYVWETFPPRAR